MNYTEEDILKLKQSLTWYVNEDAGPFIEDATWYAECTVHENLVRLYSGTVTNTLKDSNRPLWGFLYNVSIEDVPLYINSIPELAKWRLMIAK
jgi:hypothetical protein